MPLAARLALLLAALLTLLAPGRAGAYCQSPVERDGIVYWYDFGSTLQRYDLAAGAPLPSLPLSNDAYDFAIDGDTIWIERSTSIAGRPLAGGSVFLTFPVEGQILAFAGDAGHVFVITTGGAEPGLRLRSYDAQTGAPESTIDVDGYYGNIVPLSGGRLLLSGSGTVGVVSYDAEGALGTPEPVYPYDLFHIHGLARTGDRLVGSGLVLDAETLEVIESFEATGPVAFSGDELVTSASGFASSELQIFDAARDLVGVRPLPFGVGYEALYATEDAVFGLRCDGMTDGVERISRSEFAPKTLPAPIPQADFSSGAAAFATSEEGILYFLVWDQESHLRRWLPDEDRFLDSIPLRERPRAIVRAQGGGVYLIYYSGRVSRIESGGEEERAFATFPPAFNGGDVELVDTGSWVVLHDYRRLYVYSHEGEWRSYFFDPDGISNGAAWDAVRERIVTTGPETLRTFPVDADGVVTRGPDAAAPSRFPLVISPADRLLAGDHLVDLETLDLMTQLPLADYDQFGLWHNPDRLLTLSGGNPTTTYREWSADGTPLGTAVVLPGSAAGLLPFDGQRVLLVHEIYAEVGRPRVFVLVTPGGDLDQDGIPDASDAFPIDHAESSDRDGDGVGDTADAFPDDPTETADGDSDGLGDVADHLPELAAERIALLSGEDWVGIVGLGRSTRDVEAQLHLLPDGGYAFCRARETCLGGGWQRLRRDKGFAMTVSPVFLESFGQTIQAGLARDLDRGVSFGFLAKKARATARTKPNGEVRFTLRAPHRGTVAGFGRFTGAYRIRAEGEWLELGAP